MNLVIQDTDHVPPEDWNYLVEATGFTVRTKYYGQLYPQIVTHCKSNNVPIPDQQQVIDYLCRNVTVPCFEGNEPIINKWQSGIFKLPSVGCCGKLG